MKKIWEYVKEMSQISHPNPNLSFLLVQVSRGRGERQKRVSQEESPSCDGPPKKQVQAKRHLQVHAHTTLHLADARAAISFLFSPSIVWSVGGNESALNEMHFTKKRGGSASDKEKRSRSFFRHKSDNDGSCCTNIMAGHFNLPQNFRKIVWKTRSNKTDKQSRSSPSSSSSSNFEKKIAPGEKKIVEPRGHRTKKSPFLRGKKTIIVRLSVGFRNSGLMMGNFPSDLMPPYAAVAPQKTVPHQKKSPMAIRRKIEGNCWKCCDIFTGTFAHTCPSDIWGDSGHFYQILYLAVK